MALSIVIVPLISAAQAAANEHHLQIALSDSLFEAGNRDSAISLLAALAQHIGSRGRPEDTLRPTVLGRLGRYYYDATNFAAAETCFQHSLHLRENNQIGSQLDLASDCFNLGKTYLRLGKYKETVPLFFQALKIREQVLGTKDSTVAECLNGLAVLFNTQAKYRDAFSFAERAEQIWRTHSGREDANVVKALTNQAIALTQLGEYDQAERRYRHLIELREAQLGPLHPELANLLTGLANILYARADFAAAEPLFERILAISKATYGEQHYAVALATMGLAAVYTADARYRRAEALYSDAASMIESTLGAKHTHLANCLEALADVHLSLGEFDRAAPELTRALEITTASLGDAHPSCASIRSRLADVFLYQGHTKEADSLYNLALASMREALGSTDMNLLSPLNGLAVTTSRLGQFDSADSLFSEALSLALSKGGKYHPDLATTFEWYTRHLRAQRKVDSALVIARTALEMRMRNFAELVSVLPENEALRYASLLRGSLDCYLSAYFDLSAPSRLASDEAATLVFTLKGIVSDAMLHRIDRNAQSGDSGIQSTVARLRATQSALSKLYASDFSGEQLGDDTRQMVDSLEDEIRTARAVLARTHAAAVSFELNMISWENIRERLPSASRLIEFLRYRDVSPTTDSLRYRYLAVILDKAGQPRMVRLDPAKVIDSLVQEYQSHMTEVARSRSAPTAADLIRYEQISRSLFQRTVGPALSNESDSGLLIISPDGPLHVVSFAGLYASPGRYLVERFTLHYLNCAREILHTIPSHNDRADSAEGLLVLADPDFSTSRPAWPHDNTKISHLRSLSDNDCVVAVSNAVSSLPATRIEAEHLRTAWMENSAESARVLMGADASEANLRTLARGKRAIHIATHGYRVSDECAGRRTILTTIANENPLLLSGLLLAGVNRRDSSDEANDGIFTAGDASALDLRGTQWVILSACESGLGKIETGEGVYGLRRAFLNAGAASVLTSLWPISDNGVVPFMNALYQKTSTDLPTAVRSASLTSLANLRRRLMPDHPAVWAAFISLGDLAGLNLRPKK